ncbi:hypothetical protein OSSY52_08370 [Tepiditoga spiralis]|uniref:Uncharacterized protein n=1 Tax=Tepiditoga spiralis TaxID=2108365 RepID=A0A7G1G5V3_9BACT|nr:hypothetical protein [Tepiditoga spiralis]BBE30696.1 hypothetical protein OSSY52_08370 [Tepiditoga spiralis]
MKNYENSIIEILHTQGSFSKPFIKYGISLLKNCPLKKYLELRIFLWNSNDSEKNLKMIKEYEFFIKQNKNLYFKLMNEKLINLQRSKKKYESIIVYKWLKKNFKNISPKFRSIISISLFNYVAFSNFKVNKVRLWGEEIEINKTIKLFYLIGKSRESAKKELYEESLMYLNEAYIISKKIYHIPGILNSLNDYAWYSKKILIKNYKIIGRELFYILGYFKEKNEIKINILDTLDYVFDDFSKNKIELYLLINTLEKKNIPKKYIKLFKEAKKYELKTYINSYEIKEDLIIFFKENNYLKKGISKTTFFKIVNNKNKTIKSNTIKSILMKNPNIKIIDNIPYDFKNELYKIQIIKEYEKNKKIFKSLKSIKNKLMSTYSATLNRKKIFPNIIKNYDIFIKKDFKEIEKSIEYMFFVLKIIKSDEFTESRKDLFNKFIKKIKNKEKFLNSYLNSYEYEKNVMDIFIRNYVRYNIKWKIKLIPNKKIFKFIKVYGLNEQTANISLWYFENKEKFYFFKAIKNFL